MLRAHSQVARHTGDVEFDLFQLRNQCALVCTPVWGPILHTRRYAPQEGVSAGDKVRVWTRVMTLGAWPEWTTQASEKNQSTSQWVRLGHDRLSKAYSIPLSRAL